MSATPVRAVVFDAYGTLFDVRSLAGACAEAAPDPVGFAALWRAKQLEYSRLRALMRRYEDWWVVTRDALRHTAAAHGLALAPEQETALLEAWFRVTPFPDVIPTLRMLAARGIVLAILSNGSPAMLARLVTETGLDGVFAHLLSVDSVKTYKPDPAAYALAERALGFPRTAILFVSSNSWDAAGARAFGLPVAWLRRDQTPPDELGERPDHVLAGLAGLLDAIIPTDRQPELA